MFLTDFGFRGGNIHTGDESGDGYKTFPGQILVTGCVAQGAAGRMGGGTQLVAKMEKYKVFREKLSGRMYGNPAEHFYKYEHELLHVTGNQRDYADIF